MNHVLYLIVSKIYITSVLHAQPINHNYRTIVYVKSSYLSLI